MQRQTAGKTAKAGAYGMRRAAKAGAYGVRRFKANRIRPVGRKVVLTRIAVDALAVIDCLATQSGMTRGEVIAATFRKLGREAAI